MAGSVAVVPGRLDEHSPRVAVAGLGDVPPVLLFSGGVLAGGQAEVAHQLAWVREAAEVADLGEQTQRGVSRDAAERPQPRHRVSPRVVGRDLLELLVERREL